MEKARKKIRVCLIFVVTLAVVVGVIYYFRDVKGSEQITDGTLVRVQRQWQSGSGGAEKCEEV